MTWIKDFMEFLKERLSNPFLMTFLFFWVIWNWQGLVFFIYSKDDIVTNLQYINSNYADIYRNLIYPLAFAIVSILISNIFYLGLEYLTNSFVLKRKKTLFSRLTEEFNSKEDLAKAEAKYNIAKTEARTIDELNSRIGEREKEIESFKELVNELERQKSELSSSLNSEKQSHLETKNILQHNKDVELKLKRFINDWFEIQLKNDEKEYISHQIHSNIIDNDLVKKAFKEHMFYGELKNIIDEYLEKSDLSSYDFDKNKFALMLVEKFIKSNE
ncbi:hypothetical protein [Algoriphagus sp.]|jgi:uncharacterized coiled-coil protein SlyX|uniref:hypothetical protein n=1 Tax=Algoriphagus sp. TaxID=1872435 RepID=UPI0027164B0D|nr:hypothetical protein [Algoriphagus sp.]MDO8966367.1 hypothetical protein [Algoriphagus sp.]MDP3202314.1 hypothetical protein [Algoriphagus sp.]